MIKKCQFTIFHKRRCGEIFSFIVTSCIFSNQNSKENCGMLSYSFFAKIFIKIKILNQKCYIIYLNNKFLLGKGERINESSSYGGI
jgi:hypothetical protein